jgi:hypothetical protein
MPGRPHHTDKMKSCVEKVMAQGKDESSAHAICTTSLQDAGEPIFEGAESRSAEEFKLLKEALKLRALWPRADGSDDHGRGDNGGGSSNSEAKKDPASLPGAGNVVGTGRVMYDTDPPAKVLDHYQHNTRGLAHALANKENGAHVEALAKAVAEKQGYHSGAAAIIAARKFIGGGRSLESRSAEEVRNLHLLGATGFARKVVDAGKNWLVIPVVALMEGVIHAVNASTPEFVPLSTLKQAAASWNGKPVTLGHPKRDGKQCSADAPDILEAHGIGIIKNSRVEGTKLLQDVWIDCERAKKLHPEMLARLEANKTEEVSVGAFVSTDGKADQFNGKPYMASWLEAMGDHLAFLPGGRGACSVAMGCGTHRAAMRACADGLELVEPAAEFVSAFFRSLLPRGWGDDEVKQDLRDALYAIDSVARNGEILRVTNNEIIYCVYPKPDMLSPYPVEPQKMTYWKRGYSYDSATKSFTLSPDRVQVEPTTVYEELRAAAGKKPAYKDCPTCEGLGSMGGNPCPTCDGTGEMLVKAAAAPCGCGGHDGACGCERPIKFEGGRYVLYSQDGHRKLAEHSTMTEAKAHAQAISLALAQRKAS